MSILDKREQAFEKKYAQEIESDYIVRLHRAKKAALWAAELMNFSKKQTESYVEEIIATEVRHASEDHLAQRLHNNLTKNGQDISLHQVTLHLAHYEKEVRALTKKG